MRSILSMEVIRMKKIAVCLLVVFFQFKWDDRPALAVSARCRRFVADFKLPAPRTSADKNYLGVSGSFFSGPFKIPQIKAKVVIIENLQHVLPLLPGEAPTVNSLYSRIESSPALKGKIKLVGMVRGNSDYEVGRLQKRNIMLPSPFFGWDFKSISWMGEVRTPYFIGVKINPDGSHSRSSIQSWAPLRAWIIF